MLVTEVFTSGRFAPGTMPF